MEQNIESKLINNCSIYLICFVPISLVIGSLIAEINMLIINVLFLYSLVKNKDYNFFRTNYFYFLQNSK